MWWRLSAHDHFRIFQVAPFGTVPDSAVAPFGTQPGLASSRMSMIVGSARSLQGETQGLGFQNIGLCQG